MEPTAPMPPRPRAPALAALAALAALVGAACGETTATPADAGAPTPDRVLPDRPAVDAGDGGDAPPAPTGPRFCDLPGRDVAGTSAPPVFCVRRYTAVGAPRVLAFAPGGDVFVASPSMVTPGGAPAGQGAILVLPDDDRDGAAEAPVVFAGGLPEVHGLLFTRGFLYYTVGDGVYRIPYEPGQRRASAPGERVADLSNLSRAARWTHTLAQDGDGRIYVSQGQYASYTCPVEPRAGAVYEVVPGTLTPRFVMGGFRNPMYLRCHPDGHPCYAAELSDDGWTGIGGVEKLVVIQTGGDYGYPCCVTRGRPNTAAGPTPGACDDITQELRIWPLHDTPFGIDFDRGSFPPPWNHAFFAGLHGSFGGWEGTRLVWAPVDPATMHPDGQWRDFITGWGRAPAPNVGRITDVAFHPDGRMFFTDDQAGLVFWVAPTDLRMAAR